MPNIGKAQGTRQQNKEINDQKEELAAKHSEIEDLRSTLANFELKSSISIFEELIRLPSMFENVIPKYR